jgi:hypothetical protein
MKPFCTLVKVKCKVFPVYAVKVYRESRGIVQQPFVTFRRDILIVLYRIIRYKQYIDQHNSIDDFIKVYSYIVSFNDMFRL